VISLSSSPPPPPSPPPTIPRPTPSHSEILPGGPPDPAEFAGACSTNRATCDRLRSRMYRPDHYAVSCRARRSRAAVPPSPSPVPRREGGTQGIIGEGKNSGLSLSAAVAFSCVVCLCVPCGGRAIEDHDEIIGSTTSTAHPSSDEKRKTRDGRRETCIGGVEISRESAALVNCNNDKADYGFMACSARGERGGGGNKCRAPRDKKDILIVRGPVAILTTRILLVLIKFSTSPSHHPLPPSPSPPYRQGVSARKTKHRGGTSGLQCCIQRACPG